MKAIDPAEFESQSRRVPDGRQQGLAPEHEEAAHWVVDVHFGQPLSQAGGPPAGLLPAQIPLAHATAFDIAATDDDILFVLF